VTTLPISEDFHSIQGEGDHTGTSMHFIRLAGCNVGRLPEATDMSASLFPILKTGRQAYKCHTYDGRAFWCDTDFQRGQPELMDKLLADTWEDHICITGGEPLLHAKKLDEFINMAAGVYKFIHIETSGTIEWVPAPCWLTVSPKIGFSPLMIERADEVKLLVDEGFKLHELPTCILDHPNVFIQPVNNELTLNQHNVEFCRQILKEKPRWRLSIQMHKAINWR
jgi:7-carboxy-7-deazaguanine synthase